MKINTEQIKALMAARPAVIPVKSLCDAAGVNYDNMRMRIKRGGSATDAEGLMLGAALLGALPGGWYVAFKTREEEKQNGCR
jgi:hypothetical protein